MARKKVEAFDALLAKQKSDTKTMLGLVESYRKMEKAKFSTITAKICLDYLEVLWIQCLERDVELSNHREYTYREDQYQDFSAAEDAYGKACDYFTEIIQSLTPAAPSSVSTSSRGVGHAWELPPIPLPKFSGSYLEWRGFAELFRSLVIDNQSICDVERMYHLKTSLEGEPASLVKHISLSAKFEKAWGVLEKRYEDKRMLINAYLGNIMSVPAVKRGCFIDLSCLRNRTIGSLSSLKSLGCATDTWGELLVFIMSRKLDRETQMEWEMSLGASSDYPTFEQFDKFLEKQICIAIPTDDPPASASQVEPVKKVPCFICGGKHPLYRCRSFKALTAEQRREEIMENNYCFNCLKPGHFSFECPSLVSCLVCQQNHHSLLHTDK